MSESEGIRQYHMLERTLLERRKDKAFPGSDEEDELLSEMDAVWWSLGKEDQAVLDKETGNEAQGTANQGR